MQQIITHPSQQNQGIRTPKWIPPKLGNGTNFTKADHDMASISLSCSYACLVSWRRRRRLPRGRRTSYLLDQFDINNDCHFVSHHGGHARHSKILTIDFGGR